MPIEAAKKWWERIPDAWKIVVVVVAGITLVIGTYRTVESYFTPRCDFDAHRKKNKADFAELSQSFRKSNTRQDIRWNSKETYDLEKHLREFPNDEIARKRLSELREEKMELERELIITIIEVTPKNPPDPAPVKPK